MKLLGSIVGIAYVILPVHYVYDVIDQGVRLALVILVTFGAILCGMIDCAIATMLE